MREVDSVVGDNEEKSGALVGRDVSYSRETRGWHLTVMVRDKRGPRCWHKHAFHVIASWTQKVEHSSGQLRIYSDPSLPGFKDRFKDINRAFFDCAMTVVLEQRSLSKYIQPYYCNSRPRG